jgi:hypothetical protein
MVISSLHGAESSSGFSTLVELVYQRTTTQLRRGNPIGFTVPLPSDKVFEDTSGRTSASGPSEVQDLLNLVLVVRVVCFPTFFREQCSVKIIVIVNIDLVGGSSWMYDTRWLHRIYQSAASQHPPERGESDWSGSLAHGDMRPVVQE